MVFYVCYLKNTVVNVLNLFIFQLGKWSVLQVEMSVHASLSTKQYASSEWKRNWNRQV